MSCRRTPPLPSRTEDLSIIALMLFSPSFAQAALCLETAEYASQIYGQPSVGENTPNMRQPWLIAHVMRTPSGSWRARQRNQRAEIGQVSYPRRRLDGGLFRSFASLSSRRSWGSCRSLCQVRDEGEGKKKLKLVVRHVGCSSFEISSQQKGLSPPM